MSSSFINIRKIKELAQKKINDLTDQSPISEFEDLVKIVQLSGGGHLSADSDGDLPTTGMIAFDKQYDRFFYNKKAPKFRKDSTRPGGTVTDTATRITQGARRIDRGRRRRTSWSRKLYGRVNPTSSSGGSAMTQGSNYGYRTQSGYGPASDSNVIQKYSFTSDGNATDVGDLTQNQSGMGGGASSPSSGYHHGGNAPGNPYPSRIDVYSFSSDANATNAGDLASSFDWGGSAYDATHGYIMGGRDQSGSHPSYKLNAISRYPMASSGITGSDVGDLFDYIQYNGGNSSSTHGYSFGGQLTSPNPTTDHTRIEKFLFSASADATDVGDMSDVPGSSGGYLYTFSNLQSDTHGYTAGGWRRGPPNIVSNEIQKWPFSSDTNASDVGDLVANPEAAPGGIENGGGGTSSTTHGYCAGGKGQPGGNGLNIIQKFPFSSDANATDVGDLLAVGQGGTSSQY